jgi:hypothetical protein
MSESPEPTRGQFGALDRARRSFEATRDQLSRSQEQIRLSLDLLSRDVPVGVHEYRVYSIGPDGRIQRRTDLFCRNDAAARQRALELLDGEAIELWRGAHCIERFDPNPSR